MTARDLVHLLRTLCAIYGTDARYFSLTQR